MQKVLVLSPHPDDESIGCGGTLRKHASDGDEIAVVFLTSGGKGGPKGMAEEEVCRMREDEARAAAQVLGVAHVEFWREPDSQAEAGDRAAGRLREKMLEFQPRLCYVTHAEEMHSDHRAAAEIVRRAVSEWPRTDWRPITFMFEVWTPLRQVDHIVDISPFEKDKRAAILAHKSQTAVLGFDDGILGLNQYRGRLHHWPAVQYAEAFQKLHLPPLQK